jgi:transcription termination factor Rho
MAVLQRKELEESPLADLHAIASELGLEGFRSLRKAELIKAILEAQGEGGESEPSPDASEDQPAVDEDEVEAAAEAKDEEPAREEEPEVVEKPVSDEEASTGMLDVLPNGSGFLRVDPGGQSREDVYVSPAQIRRCELRAGDEVSGPMRPPRRNERHPSLVRVETVNAAPAEPPEQRPRFADLTPVFPTERLTGPPSLEGVPFGRGSRVAVGGPPGAGATTLLREVAKALADGYPELELAVVLVGVRPEEVTEWRQELEVPVSGGGFDRSFDAQVQVAELAVERAKRVVERGGHAALVLDSLEGLPAGAQRRILGAARNTQEGGTLTLVASIGMAWDAQRMATTRVMLDPPGPDKGAPHVSPGRSGTHRADLLS